MARNMDITKLATAIDRGYQILEEKKDFIEIPALKEAERSMKRRIHNAGKDSDGGRIGIKTARAGKYSPGYEKQKEKISGASNLYPINLQLRGDLLKGYTVGQLDGRNVLEFQDPLSRKKAERQEKNYKTEIFRPSDQELEDVKEVLILQFEDAMRDAFGNL